MFLEGLLPPGAKAALNQRTLLDVTLQVALTQGHTQGFLKFGSHAGISVCAKLKKTKTIQKETTHFPREVKMTKNNQIFGAMLPKDE